MARIRSVKPEFWSDEKLAPCDALTRLTFLGLISMADDAGRLLDNLKQIDAFVFPDTVDSAREALARLSEMGRIRRGKTASGQRVIQIVNWEKHQKVDHPNLRASFPELLESQEDTNPRENLASDSARSRENVATRSTIYDQDQDQDQRSTIPTHARDASRQEKVREAIGEKAREALDEILLASKSTDPAAVYAQLWSYLDPDDGTHGPGGRPAPAWAVAYGLCDLWASKSKIWNGGWFRKAVANAMRGNPPPGQNDAQRTALDRWADEDPNARGETDAAA